jgi:undecaprenyl-diphosphatase
VPSSSSLRSADRHLEHWIVGLRVDWLNWFFVGLSRIGSLGLVWLAVAAVLALLWRRPWVFASVLIAVAAADLAADVGKALVPRHRPFEHQLGPSQRTHSFPSGHAATSFAAATLLSAYAPRYRIAFFALACLIAFSRLYDGVHYPSDVLAGALLGVATALLLLAAVRRRSRPGSPPG